MRKILKNYEASLFCIGARWLLGNSIGFLSTSATYEGEQEIRFLIDHAPLSLRVP